MVTLDFILLAIILISAVVGVVQGFLREVCSLVSWVLGAWLAWKLGPSVAPHLGGTLEDPAHAIWAGRAIVFIAVLVAGAIVGALVGYFVRLSIFSGLDRLLGFVLGFVRGLVIIGIAIILAQTMRFDTEAWWTKSRLVPHLEPVASLLRGLVGDHLPSRSIGER